MEVAAVVRRARHPRAARRRVQAAHARRTRFQGLEEEGLVLLARGGATRTACSPCTEVVDSAHAEIVDALRRHPADRHAQHGELLPAQEDRRRSPPRRQQAGAVQARHGRDDRGVAAGERVHHDARQHERHPVRARHPHVRDRHALHARHHGGAGREEALDPADHRRRVASRRASRTSCPRCAARRSRSAPTASWSRCTPTRARRSATVRNRSTSGSSRDARGRTRAGRAARRAADRPSTRTRPRAALAARSRSAVAAEPGRPSREAERVTGRPWCRVRRSARRAEPSRLRVPVEAGIGCDVRRGHAQRLRLLLPLRGGRTSRCASATCKVVQARPSASGAATRSTCRARCRSCHDDVSRARTTTAASP